MDSELTDLLKTQTFSERVNWVAKLRAKGNELVTGNKIDGAIVEYLKCKNALEFGSYKGSQPTEEQIQMADKDTKVHVLNNLALCYQRIKKTDEALKMLDQVIDIDEFNSKAWQRKLTYLQESGKKDQVLKELKKVKFQSNCFDEQVRAIAKKIEAEINPASSATSASPTQTPEEIERMEEAKYLATLSNISWFIYPFAKTIKRILCGKPKTKKQ